MKFAKKAIVVAAGFAWAATASATGTYTTTNALGAPNVFATEAIGASIKITLPNLKYTMGVGRAVGQDFAIIYRLPLGVKFDAIVPTPVFTSSRTSVAGTGTPPGASTQGTTYVAPTITLKRGGAGSNEVVYSVSPTLVLGTPGVGNETQDGTVAANDFFTLTTGVINTHGLAGNSASLATTITILDQNETACVDNSGTPVATANSVACTLSTTTASLAQASNFLKTALATDVGITKDAATTTDVGATVPLAGFVVKNDDSATKAAATIFTKNSTPGVLNNTATGPYALVAGDVVTLTVTDPTGFLGLATNGLFLDLNANLVGDAGETFTKLTPAGNVATLDIAGNLVPNVSSRKLVFTSDATTPMGVSRVLGLSGQVDPSIADIAPLPWASESQWWTWDSNGTILETPFFSTFTGLNSRFAFINYSQNDVTYSATCLVENGNAATLGPKANGAAAVLLKGKQTVIQASDLCTFSGNQRAGIRFIVNAPINAVKGVHNVVNESNGSLSTIELLPPRTVPAI